MFSVLIAQNVSAPSALGESHVDANLRIKETANLLCNMDHKYDLKIETVLEQELYKCTPLMPVVVATLTGTRTDITKVYKLTKDLTPADQLGHLRRVRETSDGRIECIVCKLYATQNEPKDLEKYLRTIMDKLATDEPLLQDYRVVDVPSKAPVTEHQLAASTKVWPCKFSKNNYLIKCITGTIIDANERLVLDVITNTLLRHMATSKEKPTSGAVIFRYARVYGIGLSCCELVQQNPTKHSPMIAIDSVSKNAGGGHWPDTNQDCSLLMTLQQQLDNKPELSGHKIDDSFLPYICTNYDIVITEEPCMMCTMGLVQSRIRRLFYLDANSTWKRPTAEPVCYPDKAIEKFLIHRDKNINHRFEAWRVKLQQLNK